MKLTGTIVSLPLGELALLAATRGLLGAGIGLLVAGQLDERGRRLIGGTLVAVGALSTVPLLADVLRQRRLARRTTHRAA